MKCEDLGPEQLARRAVPPSAMSLLGLIRHLAEVERDRRDRITEGDPLPKLYGAGDADFGGAAAGQAVADARHCGPRRPAARVCRRTGGPVTGRACPGRPGGS